MYNGLVEIHEHLLSLRDELVHLLVRSRPTYLQKPMDILVLFATLLPRKLGPHTGGIQVDRVHVVLVSHDSAFEADQPRNRKSMDAAVVAEALSTKNVSLRTPRE